MNKNDAWAYLNSLLYIPCRDQFPLPPTPKSWVVMHEMVAPERHDMAESLGNYFVNPPRPASTHFGCDDDSVVRYANYYYKVYGTEQTGNVKGWHIEQAGLGNQAPAQWFDAFSKKMLDTQSSRVAAALCVIDDIPIQHVGVQQLRAGVRGITTHYEMCQAFLPGQQNLWHYDPVNFPMDYFIEQVRRQAGVTQPGDDDVPYSQWPQADKDALKNDVANQLLELIRTDAAGVQAYPEGNKFRGAVKAAVKEANKP